MKGQYVTDGQLVEALSRAVAIPSASGDEAAVAAFLADTATAWGGRSHIDVAGNVHARFGDHASGGAGPIMLVSHLDTVDAGTVSHRRTADAIYGRGSVDAKGPLLSMLGACARAQRTAPSHWVGVVEEETIFSRGAEHLRETVPAPAAVIVGEPTGTDSIGIAYKGKTDVTVVVRTPHVHSTWPHAHASERAAAAITQLATMLPPAHREQFAQLSVAVTVARLELHEAHLQLGFRTPPQLGPEQVLEVTAKAFRDAGTTIELVHHVPAAAEPRSGWLARSIGSVVWQVTGRRPRFVRKTATCDMNTLAQSWKVPMVVYGPGDSTLDHADDEHQRFEDFLTSVDVLTRVITDIPERAVS